mmetsp:Transcript_51423/g.122238  ORF Transcript_51423/g.122238 Transcript_51423/m.122238 type:complete len:256 (-) Transcript_51423:150-917(-)
MRKASKQRQRSLTPGGFRNTAGACGLNVLELVNYQDKKPGGRPPPLPSRGNATHAMSFLVKTGLQRRAGDITLSTDVPSSPLSTGSTQRSVSVSAALARLASHDTPTSSMQLPVIPNRSASPSAQSSTSVDSSYMVGATLSSGNGRASPSSLGKAGRAITEVVEVVKTDAEASQGSRPPSRRSSSDAGDAVESPVALRSSLRTGLESKRSSLSSANCGGEERAASRKRVAFAKETKDLKKVSLLDMLSSTAVHAD